MSLFSGSNHIPIRQPLQFFNLYDKLSLQINNNQYLSHVLSILKIISLILDEIKGILQPQRKRNTWGFYLISGR